MKIFTLFLICMVLSSGAVLAEDPTSVANKFYDGLGTVIENNMDFPDRCIREVDMYYSSHQSEVKMLREYSQKAMKQGMSQMSAYMEKYENMTEAELEALGKQARAQERKANDTMPGLERYNRAIEKYSIKYPMKGAVVAMKGMQLVGDVNSR